MYDNSGQVDSGSTKILSSAPSDFVEQDEPFLDDEPQLQRDLADEFESLNARGDRSSPLNFLERDNNFEVELGVCPASGGASGSSDLVHATATRRGDDFRTTAAEFADVARFNIVDVVGADAAGRVVVVFYAFRLPDSRTFDYRKFLEYITRTLDQYVEQDYTIIYFHYGLRSYNKPSTRWIINAYKLLDRKYKKNLKALYLVHPTRFIRLAYALFKPLISAKFERKLRYVNYLHELKRELRCDHFPIPVEVENHDALLRSTNKVSANFCPNNQNSSLSPTRQFGINLSSVLKNFPGNTLPPIVVQLVEYLRKEALLTQGLFRRSAALSEVEKIRERINYGEHIDFDQLDNPHLAAVLLKSFFRDLPEPLLTFELFPEILKIQDIRNGDESLIAIKSIVDRLPMHNKALLIYLIDFLNQVMDNSDVNLMNATNLAIVFGPNLARAGDEPISLAHLQHVNNFTYRLLTNRAKIFI